MSDPLVTVYIPTYNRVSLLKRAVDSVRYQTYKNIEIIIVDDVSTDDTHDYLKEISTIDLRVKYYLKEKNSGACTSRNIAIEMANGEYITGLDDDDYFLADRIEKFLENKHFLDKYVFIFTEILIKENEKIQPPSFHWLKPKIVVSNDLLYSNVIGNQCFIKTEVMRQKGMFSESLKAWQDMDVWYRLLSHTKNAQAIRVESKSYVQDISHELGRITISNRYDKIISVYKTYCDQNRLSKKERSILKGQLVSYGVKVDYLTILERFFKNRNKYLVVKNIFLIIKNFKNSHKI